MTLRTCSSMCLLVALVTPSLSRADATTTHEAMSIVAGHVVVQGEYLESPYVVTVNDDVVMINDFRVARFTGPGAESSVEELMANIERCLYRDWTLVVFDEQTRLVLDSLDTSTFWNSLLNADTVEQRVQLVFDEAEFDPFHASAIPTAQWRTALQNFEPSPALHAYWKSNPAWNCSVDDGDNKSRTDLAVDEDGVVDLASDASLVLYVLNTVGMLLAVVSFGVLINNRPTGNVAWSSIVESADTYGLTSKCLSLSVVLSVFDLVSTTFAATSADFGFIELNPLAAQLIGDPSVLTAVKLLGTGLSAGLLWSQRRYVGAQQAAWWICFVLTLVTARWVVVDSLFVC